MADGTFAVLLVVLGWADMAGDYCDTAQGCWSPSEATSRMSVGIGDVVHRRADPALEDYTRYDLGRNRGPFGQAMGLSVGQEGEFWAGYGLTYTMTLGPLYAELHLMPGLYLDNGGFDLGGLLEFRSGMEIGLQHRSGYRVGLAYDHRSNGGIFEKNPGIETVQVRVGFPSQLQ